ncbi:hypothetical protein P7C70_g2767, partial [Phenoliferia sp. Uapishka_3]
MPLSALKLPSPATTGGSDSDNSLPSPISSTSSRLTPISGSLSSTSDDMLSELNDEVSEAEYDMMASRDWGDSTTSDGRSTSSPRASGTASQSVSTSSRSSATGDAGSDRLKLSFPDPTSMDETETTDGESDHSDDGGSHQVAESAYSFLLDTVTRGDIERERQKMKKDVDDVDADATPRASRTVERGESYRVGDIHDWVQTTVSSGEMDERLDQAWAGAKEDSASSRGAIRIAVAATFADVSRQDSLAPAAKAIKALDIESEATKNGNDNTKPKTAADDPPLPHAPFPSWSSEGAIPRKLLFLAALIITLATASSLTGYPPCTSLNPSSTSSTDFAPCMASPAPTSTAVMSTSVPSSTQKPASNPKRASLPSRKVPSALPLAPSPESTNAFPVAAFVMSESRNALSTLVNSPTVFLRPCIPNNKTQSPLFHISPPDPEEEQENLPVGFVEVAKAWTLGARRTLRALDRGARRKLDGNWTLNGRAQMMKSLIDEPRRKASKGLQRSAAQLRLLAGTSTDITDRLRTIALPKISRALSPALDFKDSLRQARLSLGPIRTAILNRLSSLPIPRLPRAPSLSSPDFTMPNFRVDPSLILASAQRPVLAVQKKAGASIFKARKGLRHLARGDVGLDWRKGKLVTRSCAVDGEALQGACVGEVWL